MTIARMEVITAVQRRRRWSRTDKERIVAAALAPGAVASAVAREAGIHSSQLFRWRKDLCRPSPAPAFAAVAVAPEPLVASASIRPASPGLIEVELSSGARVRICGQADPAAISAVLGALMGGRR